ncbi:MAG TPA: hypothetical protein ENJ41_02655 [Oceanospirillales bacterium]|nr:hypothetical protein [Oceanospirillales bacterium]
MKNAFIILLAIVFITACQQSEKPLETSDEKANKPETPVAVMMCTKEAKSCPDGRVVTRNPKNNCEFDPCKKKAVKAEPLMCTADVKECPDGSYVGRDHYNNCKFKDCPPSDQGRNTH